VCAKASFDSLWRFCSAAAFDASHISQATAYRQAKHGEFFVVSVLSKSANNIHVTSKISRTRAADPDFQILSSGEISKSIFGADRRRVRVSVNSSLSAVSALRLLDCEFFPT
jgi:hypothetical protein